MIKLVKVPIACLDLDQGLYENDFIMAAKIDRLTGGEAVSGEAGVKK